MAEDLSILLNRALNPINTGASDANLAEELRSLADDLSGPEAGPAAAERLTDLRGLMNDLAQALG